jgi:hypothetical protein
MRRTGIRLAARTMAGAHSSEAAAPMKMLLRVVRPSWLEITAVIEPSCQGEGWDWGGIGNVSAFDPKTGDRLWQWQSIPKPGEPGG